MYIHIPGKITESLDVFAQQPYRKPDDTADSLLFFFLDRKNVERQMNNGPFRIKSRRCRIEGS